MTVTVNEIALPDLVEKFPCECVSPDHGEGGCDGEAWFSVVFPCGHFHELLCRFCTDLYLEGIEAGCEDCGGPLTCRDCGAAIHRLVVRPV